MVLGKSLLVSEIDTLHLLNIIERNDKFLTTFLNLSTPKLNKYVPYLTWHAHCPINEYVPAPDIGIARLINPWLPLWNT